MEDKIKKIFTYFQDIRNQHIFSLCIAQLVELYDQFPQALKLILYNMNILFFSTAKENRLKLKQRQIAANLIQKLLAHHTKTVQKFLDSQVCIQMENFQIQQAQDDQQTQINQLLEDISDNQDWNEVDYIKIIQKHPPLLASEKKYNQSEKQMKNMEKQFFDKIADMQPATQTNMKMLLGDFDVEVESDDDDQTNKRKLKKKRYELKVQKLKKKNVQNISTLSKKEIMVFNPFNYIYELAIQNLLNPIWEMRHLAILLLRSILANLKFVGFKCKITLNKEQNSEFFKIIQNNCRLSLTTYALNNLPIKKMQQIIVKKCILVLSLDRFADYQSDKSNIIIRQVAARILEYVYYGFNQIQKYELLEIIKNLLQYRYTSQNKDGLSPFSWELRQSLLYFLSLIIAPKNNHNNTFMLYEIFKSTFMSLLDQKEQDDVMLCVCECISIVAEYNLIPKNQAVNFNIKVWEIIQSLDDITYSTLKVFKLLNKFINLLSINPLICLKRIKKFFLHKIEAVRQQFYLSLIFIYNKQLNKVQFKTQQNILVINFIQFLQAIIIEQREVILSQLINLGENMFKHIIQNNFLHILVDFCKNIVIDYSTLETIVTKQFKYVGPYSTNEYLYIIREQRIYNLSEFIYARIFKFGHVVGNFIARSQYVSQIKNIWGLFMKITEEDHRNWILLTMILSIVIKKAKIGSLDYLKPEFEQVLKIQQKDIVTKQIRIFEKQIQQKLKKYTSTRSNAENQILSYISNSNVANAEKLHQLCVLKIQSQEDKQLFFFVASTIESIMSIKKEVLKYIKIFCSYCYCQLHSPEIPKPLNIVIKSIQQCIKQDKYNIISQIASQTMFVLCKVLMFKNKSIYSKFTKNTLNIVSSKYNRKKLKIERNKGDIVIQAGNMQTLSDFIQRIGNLYPDWLEEFQDHFLKDLTLEDSQAVNQSLYILVGTIKSIIKICKQSFLIKLLGLLKKKLQIVSQNSLLLQQILKSLLITFISDFGTLSNLYLQWYYDCMKQKKYIMFLVLQKCLNQQLTTMAPICSVYLLRIIKSITINNIRQKAMGCLSSIMVGAFINKTELELNERLLKKKMKGNLFIKDFKNIKNFEYNIQIKSEMQYRNYQMQGIKWMGFLVKYKLNGALCDDMGLGKTLQTLTVIENQFVKNLNKKKENLPNLIIAPNTLVQHWSYEYKKYFPSGKMNIKTIYQKNDFLFKNNDLPNLIITSYSMIEKNIGEIQDYQFGFVVLDEGHLIKNTRTKKFIAVKKIKCQHRFILTGTPIQNKLLQLWGIFDFLMPGYLSSQQVFKSKYQKLFHVNLMTFKQDDLLFTDDQKQILQALHLKVMPFILRRLKKDVLKQLPNKIIQDYHCHMTEVQNQLYQNFNNQNRGNKQQTKAITLLDKMRKIVNHPNMMGHKGDYEASGKFVALRQLFEDLGLGEDDIHQTNKILIFSRFAQTIELIENLILKPLYPSIQFLKLTGAIQAQRRHAVAQQFNDSMNIKILLATTKIGGFGLNLPSANIVIMFDHDYNPTIDMQAIDRAHRLGQKNVVNVYRLITKDTLQEKIMGIQRFKTNLANAIVNLDNSSIKNIQESKLPDLLQKITVIQRQQPQAIQKISKSFYSNLIKEMQENAIEVEDYDKVY